MRYEIMLDLYAQVDAVYTGIAVMLLFLLSTWMLSNLVPARIKPCVRGFVLAFAVLEYLGLLIFATLGGAVR